MNDPMYSMIIYDSLIIRNCRVAIGKDSSIWFHATDVTRFLGYKNHKAARHKLIDRKYWKRLRNEDFVDVPKDYMLTNVTGDTFISVLGLIEIVSRSRKRNAKRLRNWIQRKFIPSALKVDIESDSV
jgi:prophage antirepressor-like protein